MTKYYYANLGGQSRLIAFRRNGTLYYVCTDHLGGTWKVVDAQGSESGFVRYQSYGADRESGGALNTDKKFTGQTQDLSTGLYYYGARFYDAYLDRWTQPDTIVPDTKNPQALNRYSYGLNNPIRYVDPSGHVAEDLQSLVPGWYDESWRDEFVQNNDRQPQDTDYVYRFVTMGLAKDSGYASEDIMRSVTIAIGAGSTPSGASLWSQPVDQTGLRLSPQGDDRLFYGDNFSEVRWGKVRLVFTDEGTRGTLVKALGLGKDNAVTFNQNLIVFNRGLNLDKAEDQWLLLHELGHVRQAQVLGWLYLPKYMVSLRRSHGDNPMEHEANAFANAGGTGIIRWD